MHAEGRGFLTLLIGVIGIVYGDIGTSVLYALKQAFLPGRIPLTELNVYGVLSLLFWTLIFIVALKYVTLILRADNNGEGGMVAMLALASNAIRSRPRLRRGLVVVGVLGTALFYGDGIITPAISVLSAMEGLELIAPGLHPYVIPATLIVLGCLFSFQKRGTSRIARYFGPLMLLWFAVIAVLGLLQILRNPHIIRATLPTYAASFVLEQPAAAFFVLGALVLCVTGVEALYADMGHFGRRPIRFSWFAIVMPALSLNYFGQGALMLAEPNAVQQPFYMLAPGWALIPLVILAAMATIVASQAVISGIFSVTKQAIQLGYLPRLRINHTSTQMLAQIYIPFINWALFIAIFLVVMYFRNSSALASAYGVAICGLMLCTTILSYFVIRYSWGLSAILSLLSTGIFLLVDVAFLSSAILKVATGGWFPLALGIAIFGLMMSWHHGHKRLDMARKDRSIDILSFLDGIFATPPARAPGTAVFLTADPQRVPGALLHNLKHNKVLHEQNVFLTVKFHEQPWIPVSRRVDLYPLGNRCFRILLHYGFKDDPHVPEELARIQVPGFEFEPASSSYFIGRDDVVPAKRAGRLVSWENKVFSLMHRNASAIADHLKLPANAVVELGGMVEI